MGPIQVKDGVLSNNDYIERDKNGIVTDVKVTKKTKTNKRQFIYYVLWENFNCSIPHSRKSLSRDHSIRDRAKKYFMMSEKKIKKQKIIFKMRLTHHLKTKKKIIRAKITNHRQ